MDVAELRRLAEAAAKARECDGRMWVPYRNHWADGGVTVHEVVHRDPTCPADLDDSFDVFADPSEPVANYVAALHPAVLLALLDRLA
jgi:hypothetical protein